MGAWSTGRSFKNAAIEAAAQHFDTYSTVTLKDGHYSLAKIITESVPVKPKYFYKIDVRYETQNPDTVVEVLEIYRNSKGEELRCQYVEEDGESISPADAASLCVYALVRGNEKDTVKVYTPELTELSPYKKRNVTLAAICIDKTTSVGRKRTVRDNIDYVFAKIDELCADPKCKPDVILMTERFHTIGVKFSSYYDSFIGIDGDIVNQMRAKAKEHGIYLCFSIRELGSDGNYYNAAPLIDREGNIVLHYRKTHLTMGEVEAGIRHGDEIAVYDTDFGRVGIAICWDLFFGDFTALYRDRGVELILNPSLGYWKDINSMRAEDTGAYILTCGQKNSMTAILRPEGHIKPYNCADFGNVICRAGDNGSGGVALATVDLNERHAVMYLSSGSTAERRNVYKHESNPGIYKKYAK